MFAPFIKTSLSFIILVTLINTNPFIAPCFENCLTLMLQFENIKKYYGSSLAIEISSMVIDKGLWWIQGENGSGKTTFLKMITGLLPFTGDIILDQKFSLKKQRQQYVRSVNYAESFFHYCSCILFLNCTSLSATTSVRYNSVSCLLVLHTVLLYFR